MYWSFIPDKEESHGDTGDQAESRTSSRNSGRTSRSKGRRRQVKRPPKIKEEMVTIQEKKPAAKTARYIYIGFKDFGYFSSSAIILLSHTDTAPTIYDMQTDTTKYLYCAKYVKFTVHSVIVCSMFIVDSLTSSLQTMELN